MKLPSVTLSIRISHELWHRINEFVENSSMIDFSSGVRALIESGLWLDDHKEDICDPDKASKIITEWTSKINENEILDWPKQLSDDQIRAIEMAFDLEKERRCKL